MKKILNKFYELREKYISYNTYIVLLSILIGVLSAIAAVLLKNLVQLCRLLFHSDWFIQHTQVLYFVFPLIGILMTIVYVKYIYKGEFNKGLSHLIYLLSRKNPEIPRQHIYSHLITSAATVGFGGSVGLEAPIVMTGAAIGANTSNRFRLTNNDRNLLIACGAASGISAIFNSPIAGIIFAFEVLLPQIAVSSFIPLIIASASASIFSNLLISDQILHVPANDWNISLLPYVILFGVISGFFSSYTIKTIYKIDQLFQPLSTLKKFLIGGTALAILIFLLPPLFGEGYDTINALVNKNYNYLLENSIFSNYVVTPWGLLIVALIIIFMKVLATSFTLSAGGNGGIFAPSLLIGAMAGFCFAYFFNLMGWQNLPVEIFIVLGMAGLMSGVLGAPLTGLFLIAELTGGYHLFIPLMVVVAISYFITRKFEPYSIYTKLLAQTRGWNRDNVDMLLLEQIKLTEVLETDFVVLNVNDPNTVVREKVFGSKHKFFPVVDDNGKFLGLLHFHQLKDFFLQNPKLDINWNYLIKPVKYVANIGDNIDEVLQKMEEFDLWSVPVVANHVYVGFVFRSRILNRYRILLKQHRQYF